MALRLQRCSPRGRRATPRSPLVEFQLDTREVKHMSPHILSVAVLSAGTSGQGSEALWRAYQERALIVRPHLTCRDLRSLLQGFAEGAVRDAAFLQDLVAERAWDRGGAASGRDLCSIAASLARLKFRDEAVFGGLAARVLDAEAEPPFAALAELVSALAQVSCRQPALLQAAAARLGERLRAPPAELSPAVAASTLHALALCSHCDAALSELFVARAALPRAAEFSAAQAALVADALARSARAAPLPAASLEGLAERWAAQGLEHAGAEELARLAHASARLRVASEALGLALASAALRRLSAFGARQLAAFCGALRWLPSPGRAAFLAMAAQHAVLRVCPDCSLVELGSLLDAFTAAGTTLPEPAARALLSGAAAKAREAAPGGPWATDRAPGEQAVGSRTLAALATASTRFSDAQQGQQLLAVLQPHVEALCRQRHLRPHAIAAFFAACAHFQVRDLEALERTAGEAARCLEAPASPAETEQLLVSLGSLDARPAALLERLGGQLAAAARQLSLEAAARCLLAAAVLGAEHLPGSAVEALLSRARELSLQAPAATREEARLAAAMAALRPGAAAEAGELRGAAAGGARAHRLEPPPPPGLLRAVLRALHGAAGDGELSVGGAAHGFHADVVLERAGASTAVEVDGPRRFYRGSRELLGLCKLKHRLLERKFGRVVRIGYWEWPAQGDAQRELLRARGIA